MTWSSIRRAVKAAIESESGSSDDAVVRWGRKKLAQLVSRLVLRRSNCRIVGMVDLRGSWIKSVQAQLHGRQLDRLYLCDSSYI